MKKALLVGINDYSGEANDLPSSIEDVRQFRQLLVDVYGFAEGDIRTLSNGEAVTSRVKEQFRWLVSDAKPGDQLVFYFSGHGCQLPHDGVLEECLALRDDPLMDEELVKLSRDLPANVLTLVIDACFSGGTEKRFFVAQRTSGQNGIIERTRAKVWMPTTVDAMNKVIAAETSAMTYRPFGQRNFLRRSDEGFTAALRGGALHADIANVRDEGAHPSRLNALVICACAETETAAASTSRTNGTSAFTGAFVRVLRQAPSMPLREASQRIATELEVQGFVQTPVVIEPPRAEGAIQRPFLASGMFGSFGHTHENQVSDLFFVIRPLLSLANGATMLNTLVPQLLRARPHLDVATARELRSVAMFLEQSIELTAQDRSFWSSVARALPQNDARDHLHGTRSQEQAPRERSSTLLASIVPPVIGALRRRDGGSVSPWEIASLSRDEAFRAIALIAPLMAEADGMSAIEKSFWRGLATAFAPGLEQTFVASTAGNGFGTEGNRTAQDTTRVLDALRARATGINTPFN